MLDLCLLWDGSHLWHILIDLFLKFFNSISLSHSSGFVYPQRSISHQSPVLLEALRDIPAPVPRTALFFWLIRPCPSTCLLKISPNASTSDNTVSLVAHSFSFIYIVLLVYLVVAWNLFEDRVFAFHFSRQISACLEHSVRSVFEESTNQRTWSLKIFTLKPYSEKV